MPGRRLSGEDRERDIVLGYHSESRIVQAAGVKLSNGVGMSRGGRTGAGSGVSGRRSGMV